MYSFGIYGYFVSIDLNSSWKRLMWKVCIMLVNKWRRDGYVGSIIYRNCRLGNGWFCKGLDGGLVLYN